MSGKKLVKNSKPRGESRLRVQSTPLASSTAFGSRLNLDFSAISDVGRSVNNSHGHKLDLAYNEYLQSMFKKRIITSTIRSYDDMLQKQISYQEKQIDKMKKILNKRKDDLEVMKQQNTLVETLHKIEEKVEEFHNIRVKNGCTMKDLTDFSNILTVVREDLELVGIKKFVVVDEWFLFLKILNECSNFLKNYFESNKSMSEFELIDSVSSSMSNVLYIQTAIQEDIAKSSSLSKEMCCKYLSEMSELLKLLEETNPQKEN